MPHFERCHCSAAIVTLSRRSLREWREVHGADCSRNATDPQLTEHGHSRDEPLIFESNGSAIERDYYESPPGRPRVDLSLATPAGSLTRHVPLGYSIG